MAFRTLPAAVRARGVTAVLGPTNTGKTHLAIERMVGHQSGIIGLPLRLLAREVYQRVVAKVGAQAVALVTGEEKIKPPVARYWVCTIEAMPRDLDVSFCAIDEIQLAADFSRGHVFTDRLLNMRGRAETLVIGSATMRPLVEALLPGADIVARPRLSTLAFAGEKKMTRLPPRSAVVAFSIEEVYAVAELIRRQRGGAAVVLGALSPRTRNAQVELFQSGEVDYLVATDAIGLGLNLDLDHVAFAGDRKFDGFGFRRLNPSELGQIAGRAGRHLRDGTFGTTGRCPAFEPELVRALEDHAFDPVRMLQWRNPNLDTRSIGALLGSLSQIPKEAGLTRAPIADDQAVLEVLAKDEDVRSLTRGRPHVELLWDVCQVPDYRKVSPQAHADLVGTLFRGLTGGGKLDEDWFARQIAQVDRSDGDIDALSARIAQVRTWTYVANRPDWLADPQHWQGRARQVEDNLSDALHERLTSRFVDRRTSVLMRRLRENAHMEAEVTPTGDVSVEGQHVGNLSGFHFVPDPQADGSEAKALRAAAQKALASEIEARADRLAAAVDEAFVLSNDGTVRWLGDAVAKLAAGDKLAAPRLIVLADDSLMGGAREKVEARLDLWLKAHVTKLLGPLLAMEDAEDLTGLARGIAFQLVEALGVLERSRIVQDVKALDQTGRAQLRKHGVRFGAYHIYMPQLLKPAPRSLSVQLWALKHGGSDSKGLDDLPHLAASGRTSIPVDATIDKSLYRAAGFRVCGNRAVRVDILERLADLIRPAVTYRPGVTPGDAPVGAADGEGFVVTVAMTSLVGCAGEDFASILRSLGYMSEQRPGPAITVPLLPKAAVVPAAEVAASQAEAAQFETGEGADEAAEASSGDASPISAEVDSTPAFDEASAGLSEPALEASTTAVDGEGVADTVVEAEAVPAEATAPVAEASAAEAVADAAVEAVTTDVVAADGPAADAAIAAEPDAAVEPEMIEVWRPHRQQRGPRPNRDAARGGRSFRRDHGNQPQAAGSSGAAAQDGQPGEGQGQAAEGERGPRRGDRSQRFKGSRAPWGAEGRGQEARGQDSRGQGARGQEGRSQEARGQEGRSHGNRPDNRGADNRGGRPDGRRGGDRRFDSRDEHRDDRRGGAPKVEKQPDPDSPFAKLLILKERMKSGDDKR